MKSLPTDPDYYAMQDSNTQQLEILFKQFFPQFPQFNVPFEDVFKILTYLEETNVNPAVLPRVIRGLHNLSLGTGNGEVVIHVRNNQITIETREKDGEITFRNIHEQ